MKKIFSLSLVLILCSFIVFPRRAQAEMPVKARAFLTIVGYGAGGGALLGIASMAFGNSTRAVAQGASLGLYAGILFGTYVLVSHHQKQMGNYEDNGSPYQESRDIYGDEYDSSQGGDGDAGQDGGNFYDRIKTMEMRFKTSNKNGGQIPPLYLNLFQMDF
jgi:hypothetical protein